MGWGRAVMANIPLGLCMCYGIVSPQISYGEILTPNVTVFRDRASKEVIHVNEVLRVGL